MEHYDNLSMVTAIDSVTTIGISMSCHHKSKSRITGFGHSVHYNGL